MILSDEFEDATSLMEIQRVNPAKLKDNEEVDINFHEKPNQSQKQISKLIKVFDTQTVTRSEYLTKLNKDE